MLQGASSSLLVLLVVLTAITYYLVQRFRPKSRCSSSAAPLPPGPQPWPVVGNLPEMMLNKPAVFRWIHLVMKEMGTDIACFRFGRVHVISVTCPKIAMEVFKKQDANFASRPLTFASSAAGGGYKEAVLSPVGDQWRKMRRMLVSEVVSPSRHRWLHDKRADEADHFTRYLYNKIAGGAAAVDVRHVARHFTGNVIRRLLFGSRYLGEPQPDGGPGRMERDQIDASFAVIAGLFSFCVSDYLPWLVGFDLDGHEKLVKEANATLDRLHNTAIDERWRQWKTGEKEEVEDLLDVLVTHKDGDGHPLLTIEEVKAQTKIIILAAVDNPSNAVEWALAEMVNNPKLLRNAVEEMDRVVGRERLVQETDIPRLNYAKACIREAFRQHPVDPFNLPHVALADTTVAGYRVPKGSHVLISRVGLGRNPTVWDEPQLFKPERHLEDGVEVVLTESEMRFISFGIGRRGCVATSLGTAMTVMLFGRLLQGFTWSKPSEVTSIDLSESKNNLYMAKPLVLHAEPRLPVHLYNLQP